VVEGRTFDGRDAADGPPVALVNRALVRRYLAGEPAVGRRVRLGPEDAPWATIVGVVGDVHHAQLSRAPDPEVYVPLAQAPPALLMLAVRTDGRPEEQAASVRAAIQAVDPAQPVYHVKTMGQLVSDSLLAQTMSATLMTLFSALALALAAVGVYGVVAYGVSQQTREFGLRIALGATPRDVLALVLGQGLRLVSLGVLLGAVSALAATRLMGGILYGVGPADPHTYLGVVSLLIATGFVAASVPAWRASRVTPVEALRVD
jgi:putative ABC transport system permease protein